nr:zinc finger protein ZAT11-like [Ipomoea batatas]GME16568.1 zinc finger protein ZAT11-like [Ipomoea batatas]GME21302.1 zinc finger protein ZAT11-like [Ipomoea batatas]GME21303.1 zinc finger protein ZAT11-like [Ipomoea batatas]
MTMLMKRSRDYAGVEAEAMANCLMLLAHVGRNDLCSFQCKTCDKKFSSFQALGGHRASHKKPKLAAPAAGEQESSPEKSKMHRCSICGLEFAMGQALGGHMRRHRAAMMKDGAMAMAVPVLKRTTSSKRIFGFGLNLDLNLTPAENDDDLKIESTRPATPVLRCFI